MKMINRIDIELAKANKDKKETLQDILVGLATLIVISIVATVIIYQTIKIDKLEKENYRLDVEVQSLKEVIE